MFFNLGEVENIERGDEPRHTPRVHNCNSCGLFRDCRTPKTGYIGEGRLGILIVGEGMTRHEDQNGNTRHGLHFNYLQEFLEGLGYDLLRDFWYTHAIRCYTKNKNYGNTTISACHQMMLAEIQQLKPRVIIPTNSLAWQVLVYDRMAGRAKNASFWDWCGETIPDQKLGTWIAPIFDPEWVRDEDQRSTGFQANKYHPHWRLQVERAVALRDQRVPAYDYESKVKVAATADEACEYLEIVRDWPAFAFDYEATGIKPHLRQMGHAITCMAFSDGKVAYGFPYFRNERLSKLLREVLEGPARKVAQNKAYEASWSLVIAGIAVNNLVEDTMYAQHCLNNVKPTGLKFMTFARYGILGYDSDVEPFMKASEEDEKKWGKNAKNKMHQAPVRRSALYCGYDALFEYWLYEDLVADLHKKNQYPGYRLFCDASAALEDAHQNGMLVRMADMDVIEAPLRKKMEAAMAKIMDNRLVTHTWDWNRVFNPKSDDCVRHMVYDILGQPVTSLTEGGQPAVDEDTLLRYRDRCELVPDILEYRRWFKVLDTYFASFRREAVDGVIHPFFNLGGVKTYRSSCVAEGTKIFVNRDYEQYPDGVPIELVREGDLVYCFDDDLKPTLRPVEWAGKTGHRETIRIHWKGNKDRRGYVDVTPEHLVRLLDGTYVRADSLMEDTRDREDPKWKWQPKCRVLSMHRDSSPKGDRLWATNNDALKEHHFVWESITGDPVGNNHIHHKNGNHGDHVFSNLEKLPASEHTKLHYNQGIGINTPESRAKNREVVKKNHAAGKYDHVYKVGKDNVNYLHLSYSECMHELFRIRGMAAKTSYDFDTFKRKCYNNGIDIKKIALHFNNEGTYINKNKIMKLLKDRGFSETHKHLKISYYALKRLCEEYNIGYDRAYKNQVGYHRPQIVTENNHIITKIEYTGRIVDVYDIRVKDFHNFIGNELTLHNSNAPNFQNIPKRDKEVKKIIRSILTTIPGHRIVEYDFKGMEVSIAAAVSGDPNLIRYVSDLSTDMHRDIACDLFFLTPDRVPKALRNDATKGPFTFAEFYGSWWREVALGVWEEIAVTNAVDKYGFDIVAHLEDNGILSYEDWEAHVKDQERALWEERFPVYKEFREKTYHDFCKRGYVNYVNGFRYYGPATKNEVLNGPIQGPAFHILLWSMHQVWREMKERKMESFMIGQIHDAMLPSVLPAEEEYVDHLAWLYSTQKVREHWDWITVPLMVEKERSAVAPAGNWAEMEACGFLKG